MNGERQDRRGEGRRKDRTRRVGGKEEGCKDGGRKISGGATDTHCMICAL